MDALSTQVAALLGKIFKCVPEIQEEGPATVIRIKNHSGGLPLLATVNSWQDIRIQPGKTPRYYPVDALASLSREMEAYAAGTKVVVDAVDVDGQENEADRLINLNQLDNLTAEDLQKLTVNIGLIGSRELDHLLLMGGKFRVMFWDAHKNFVLKYGVDKLVKVTEQN